MAWPVAKLARGPTACNKAHKKGLLPAGEKCPGCKRNGACLLKVGAHTNYAHTLSLVGCWHPTHSMYL